MWLGYVGVAGLCSSACSCVLYLTVLVQVCIRMGECGCCVWV